MKKIFTFLAACVLALSANATLILHESFNYTTGDLYSAESTNGWWQYTKNATDPIQVVSGSLTYAGYESTAIGQSIKLKNAKTAQKVYKKFDSNQMVASGSIYYAALINIASADSITAANTSFFMAMCAQTKNGLSDGGVEPRSHACPPLLLAKGNTNWLFRAITPQWILQKTSMSLARPIW